MGTVSSNRMNSPYLKNKGTYTSKNSQIRNKSCRDSTATPTLATSGVTSTNNAILYSPNIISISPDNVAPYTVITIVGENLNGETHWIKVSICQHCLYQTDHISQTTVISPEKATCIFPADIYGYTNVFYGTTSSMSEDKYSLPYYLYVTPPPGIIQPIIETAIYNADLQSLTLTGTGLQFVYTYCTLFIFSSNGLFAFDIDNKTEVSPSKIVLTNITNILPGMYTCQFVYFTSNNISVLSNRVNTLF